MIREYIDGDPVRIAPVGEIFKDRPVHCVSKYGSILPVETLVIFALNDGGYASTVVDLLDVIKWVKENKPELL